MQINSGIVIGGVVTPKNVVNGGVEKATTIYKDELEFKNFKEFPAIGKDDKLYIATDENACYRWDDTEQVYKCCGRDYNEVDVIQVVL